MTRLLNHIVSQAIDELEQCSPDDIEVIKEANKAPYVKQRRPSSIARHYANVMRRAKQGK
jgi:hypothetical protein